MTRVQWVAVVGILAIALAAGAWFGGRAPEPPPVSVALPTSAPPVSTLTVHVAGAVVRPGLVVLPSGARVADAVAAARGVTADADLDRLNLAAAVHDGEQISVPRRGAASEGGQATDGRVRINQAGAGEIEALPGIGPVTAAQIVAYREQHGPFASVEDLLDVPGIGEGKLAALRDVVVVP